MVRDLAADLNRVSPATARAGLGDRINELATNFNALLARMDNMGQVAEPATETIVIGGTITATDVVTLTFTNAGVTGLPVSEHFTVGGGDTKSSIAAGLKALMDADLALQTAQITGAISNGNTLTVSQPGLLGNSTVITKAVSGAASETVTFGNGGDMHGGTVNLGTDNVASFAVRTLADIATANPID